MNANNVGSSFRSSGTGSGLLPGRASTGLIMKNTIAAPATAGPRYASSFHWLPPPPLRSHALFERCHHTVAAAPRMRRRYRTGSRIIATATIANPARYVSDRRVGSIVPDSAKSGTPIDGPDGTTDAMAGDFTADGSGPSQPI